MQLSRDRLWRNRAGDGLAHSGTRALGSALASLRHILLVSLRGWPPAEEFCLPRFWPQSVAAAARSFRPVARRARLSLTGDGGWGCRRVDKRSEGAVTGRPISPCKASLSLQAGPDDQCLRSDVTLAPAVAVEPSTREARRSLLPSDEPSIDGATPGTHALLAVELSQAQLPTVWSQGIRPQRSLCQ